MAYLFRKTRWASASHRHGRKIVCFDALGPFGSNAQQSGDFVSRIRTIKIASLLEQLPQRGLHRAHKFRIANLDGRCLSQDESRLVDDRACMAILL